MAQGASKCRFLARGYSLDVIDKAIRKANMLSRVEALAVRNIRADDLAVQDPGPTRLILTYNRQHQAIRKILNNCWSLINSDPVIGDKMSIKPDIVFRKARSMSDTLVKSSPEILINKSWLSSRKGFVRCSTCKACKCGVSRTSYRTPFHDVPILISKMLTCKTEFSIYVLECPCGPQYVGSTKLQVHKRILQHESYCGL